MKLRKNNDGKANQNPMRWLVYLAVFGLILCISRMLLDATRSNNDHVVHGVNFGSLLDMNPLAPFQILFTILFLYLYVKHSKYAWHAIAIPFLLSYPISVIFRAAGVYFLPHRHAFENWFWLMLWVLLLIYMLGLRKRYISFLSSQEGEQNSERGKNKRLT